MKKLFLLAVTVTGICTFSISSAIAGSHFENFVSDKRIFEAKTVKCVYPTTAIVNWEELDEPDPEIDEPDKPLEYTFDSIGQQQARLIGNVGVSDVVVLRTSDGLHLLEILPAGSVNTTTIYSSRENVPSGYFASVASRHPYIIGPAASQSYGKCKVLEYHQ
jgi:hypothetical protein